MQIAQRLRRERERQARTSVVESVQEQRLENSLSPLQRSQRSRREQDREARAANRPTSRAPADGAPGQNRQSTLRENRRENRREERVRDCARVPVNDAASSSRSRAAAMRVTIARASGKAAPA